MTNSILHLFIPARYAAIKSLLHKKGTVTDQTSPLIERLLNSLNLNGHHPPIGKLTAKPLKEYTQYSYWLRADPSQWQINLNGIYFAGVKNNLDFQNTQHLIDYLNKALNDMRLFALSAQTWVIGLNHDPHIITTPTYHLPHQPISLPQGDHSWHNFLTEIQILLQTYHLTHHALSFNSIWLWGEGKLPLNYQLPIKQAWGQSELLTEIAPSLNLQYSPHIPNLNQCLAHLKQQPGEYILWFNSIDDFNIKWPAALLTAIKSKQLTSLHINFLDKHYHLTQKDLKWFSL